MACPSNHFVRQNLVSFAMCLLPVRRFSSVFISCFGRHIKGQCSHYSCNMKNVVRIILINSYNNRFKDIQQTQQAFLCRLTQIQSQMAEFLECWVRRLSSPFLSCEPKSWDGLPGTLCVLRGCGYSMLPFWLPIAPSTRFWILGPWFRRGLAGLTWWTNEWTNESTKEWTIRPVRRPMKQQRVTI